MTALKLLKVIAMGKHKLFYQNSKLIRDSLNEALDLAMRIHELEKTLIEKLQRIDQGKYYIRYGHRSLTGFCRYDLKFTKTKAQRILTQVRRSIPTANILDDQNHIQLKLEDISPNQCPLRAPPSMAIL